MSAIARYLFPLTLFAAVGAGMVAGLLFAFSSFVMRALLEVPGGNGMIAMQRINVLIVNPLFLILFMGTAVASGILVVHGVLERGEPGASWLVVGGLAYLLGVIGVTMVFNVPLNNALAPLSGPSAVESWQRYVASWIRWNHVRTIAAIGAAVAISVALARSRGAVPN